MKFVAQILLFLCSSSVATAFTVAPSTTTPARQSYCSTGLAMFTGAGEGMPTDENPEQLAQMEQAAKQMGMSLDEYKLGMNARVKLTQELNNSVCVGGDPATVAVERDGHNPPQTLRVIVTEAGKAQGKEAVSQQLVQAMKSAAQKSKDTREAAQKKMMTYISDEMKKLGISK